MCTELCADIVSEELVRANSGLCECLIIVATRTPVAGAEGSTQTEPTFR